MQNSYFNHAVSRSRSQLKVAYLSLEFRVRSISPLPIEYNICIRSISPLLVEEFSFKFGQMFASVR